MKKIPRILLVVLSIAGMSMMAYLAYIHIEATASSFCELGEGVSCEAVNTSEYSKVLGIPISWLGFLFFAGILFLAVAKPKKSSTRLILFGAVAFLIPSLYLTYLEIAVIKSICIFCEASKFVMLLIILTAADELRSEKLKPVFLQGLAMGVIGVFVLMMLFGSQGPGDKYDKFTECLVGEGFKMYGSATCASCARQRKMIGNEVFHKHIREIECDPRNENSQEELCIRKNIKHTPTWIQEDEAGNELFRFEAGVQSLENLSEASGCPLVEEGTIN